MAVVPMSQSLRDRIVRHEVLLHRLSNKMTADVIALLRKAEQDVAKQIEKRLAWIAERGYDSSPYTLARLESNLSEVQAVLKSGVAKATGHLGGELRKLAKHEGTWAASALEGTLRSSGVELGVGLAEGDLLRSIVTKEPFKGGLLREWTANLQRTSAAGVKNAVRQGLLQGESIGKIVQRVRGTKAGGFKDGVMQMTRRNAESVVRTAVSHVANAAREATWKENDDVIKGIQWVSTLDDRTTPECAIRDGKMYDLDYEPIGHSVQWEGGPGALHWNCRSTSAPVLKSWKEMGIDAREITGEQRAAMDGFVPAEQDFGRWATDMAASGNKQVLVDLFGVKRADALLNRQITFKDLFNAKGEFLSLKELKLADPAGGVAATKKLIKPPGKPPVPAAPIARPLPTTMEEFEAMLNDAGHRLEVTIEKVSGKRGILTGRTGTPGNSGPMTPVEHWNAVVGMRPDDFVEQMVGGQGRQLRGRMSLWDEAGRVVKFDGSVMELDAAGDLQEVATISRQIRYNTAEHSYFEVTREVQGKGLAKEVLRGQFEVYKKLGVTRVELDANINIGGYAWAKYGFKPTNVRGWTHLRERLRSELQFLADNRTRYKELSSITDADLDAVEALLLNDDPRAVWALADMKTPSGVEIGKKLLIDSSWRGAIDLNDAAAMRRFNAYINRGAR